MRMRKCYPTWCHHAPARTVRNKSRREYWIWAFKGGLLQERMRKRQSAFEGTKWRKYLEQCHIYVETVTS